MVERRRESRRGAAYWLFSAAYGPPNQGVHPPAWQEEALDSAHRTLNCCQPCSGWCQIKTFLRIESRIKLLFRNLLRLYALAPQWITPMDVPHRIALPLGQYYS